LDSQKPRGRLLASKTVPSGRYAVTAGLGAALGHEAPAVEAGGIGEQVLERPAKAEFVLDTLSAKGRERALVFAGSAMGARKSGRMAAHV